MVLLEGMGGGDVVTWHKAGTRLLGAPGWSLGAEDKGTQPPWCLILAWNLYLLFLAPGPPDDLGDPCWGFPPLRASIGAPSSYGPTLDCPFLPLLERGRGRGVWGWAVSSSSWLPLGPAATT